MTRSQMPRRETACPLACQFHFVPLVSFVGKKGLPTDKPSLSTSKEHEEEGPENDLLDFHFFRGPLSAPSRQRLAVCLFSVPSVPEVDEADEGNGP
jgi:hypothetical protein